MMKEQTAVSDVVEETESTMPAASTLRIHARAMANIMSPEERCVRQADLIERQQKTIDERDAKISRYEARLEIDHVWVSQGDGPMERVEIQPEKRDEQIDGIECRDETIKLARARIEEVAKEARDRAIDECAKVVRAKIQRHEEMPGFGEPYTYEELIGSLGVAESAIMALKEKQP